MVIFFIHNCFLFLFCRNSWIITFSFASIKGPSIKAFYFDRARHCNYLYQQIWRGFENSEKINNKECERKDWCDGWILALATLPRNPSIMRLLKPAWVTHDGEFDKVLQLQSICAVEQVHFMLVLLSFYCTLPIIWSEQDMLFSLSKIHV